VPDSEIAALHDLYDATNGDFWNWEGPGNIWNFTNPNPCVDAWQGVNCSQVVSDGFLHVVELALQEYGLIGTIPSSIAQLTQLVALNLSLNALNGTIPDCVGELAVLTELYLGRNRLSGTIPATLGQLTQLKVLALEYNLLTATLPDSFQQLTQLTQLHLDGNLLNGTIPSTLGGLTQLTHLALGNNQLTGSIPNSLQQLTQLRGLYLSHNRLAGAIPASLGELMQLEVLRLDSNLLTGTVPNALMQLSQLTGLFLNSNLLSGTVPSSLGELTQLRALGVAFNLLSGTIPESSGQLTQLTYLFLDSNQLTGTIPASLSLLTQLTVLNLDFNLLSGTIPDLFQQLTQLKLLYLGYNQLSGAIPPSVDKLVQLQVLDLGYNVLSGSIPDAFQQLTQLTQLYLDINQLTGAIPDSLVTLPQLKILQVGTNLLTGRIPQPLSQLAKLEVLVMQNNLLTGPIPPSLGQLTQLRAVYFDSNHLQGSIPQTWTAIANAVQVLHLQENRLSSSIPESLGSLPQLLSLNLSSNRLTGTLPASAQQLRSLRMLMLHSNQLQGNTAELFSPLQANLSTVQLSGNQLTGTLPAAAFLLPSLTSFAAVDNCFEGPLPEDAICSSTSLTALVLDGLHSALFCKRSVLRSHSAFKLGSLPSCLLTMPNLVTLHLSGSGLTGSLPAGTNISAVLTDLSLSHNLLQGHIPRSIIDRNWDKLDLSYNRLTGTLHGASAVPFDNTTAVYLQHNRLSGVIPGSMQRVGGLSILENNMFSCRLDRSDVPQQASDSDKYTCGSDAVNQALYAWLGAAVAMVGVVVGIVTSQNQVGKVIPDLLGATARGELPRLADVISAARLLAKLGAGSAVYCIAVLLPIYAAVNSYHPSFTYKYAWTVSGVYLTGTTAFALEVVFLLLQLPLCAYVVERWQLARGQPPRRFIAASDVVPAVGSDKARQRTANVTVLLVSLAVVTGINVAFVFATLNLNGTELTILQILLAVFKLGFNNIAAPALHNRVKRTGTAHDITASQLALMLLNVVVVPCLVVMVISPACFYDALRGTDSVTSSFQYGGSCLQDSANFDGGTGEGTVSCTDTAVQTKLGTTTYTPPFTYSYQCSSSFVTFYAPTFVIMCMISGFMLPAYRLLLIWLRSNLSPVSRFFSVVTVATPRILRELRTPQNLAQARSDPLYRPVFDANKLMMSLLTYLALLLTFGALFPPLAVCCAVAMASLMLTARLEVGRYVGAAVAADRQDCLDEVESACAGVATPQQLRMALYLVLTVSCLFYTLFLFDTLGYEVGFAGAFWVLIVVPLLPLVAWALYTAAARVRSRGPETEDNKTDHAADPEIAMELAGMHATKDNPGGVDAVSANPIHVS
jgi:Leucine-rich repeat (LRR) protein